MWFYVGWRWEVGALVETVWGSLRTSSRLSNFTCAQIPFFIGLWGGRWWGWSRPSGGWGRRGILFWMSWDWGCPARCFVCGTSRLWSRHRLVLDVTVFERIMSFTICIAPSSRKSLRLSNTYMVLCILIKEHEGALIAFIDLESDDLFVYFKSFLIDLVRCEYS
jgi:hypothetical protein